MLISKKQRALIVASALLLGACATTSAPTGTPNAYVTDTRNAIVKDPYNLCWRTGYWTPALANCECDPRPAAEGALRAARAARRPAGSGRRSLLRRPRRSPRRSPSPRK